MLWHPGACQGWAGGRAGRALTLVPAPGADLVPAFARTKLFVRRVERVAAERAILACVVVVLVGRHRLAVCTSSLTEQKKCSLAHAGALCPPATRRFESRLFSREVSLTPESAALHAPRGRHRGLPSSPKTDERDDARLEKEPVSRDGHVIGRHFEIDLGEKFKSSSSAPRAVTRYEYARSRRDCGVERTRS